MRINKHEPSTVNISDKSGRLVASLFNSYTSVADAIQAARQYLTRQHRNGVYQVNIYQDSKAWSKHIRAQRETNTMDS